jgi:hypothetical protein
LLDATASVQCASGATLHRARIHNLEAAPMSPARRRLSVVCLLVPLSLALLAAVGRADDVKESKRVVAVIVVDSKDKNIGKAVAKDGELVSKMLKDGFSNHKDQLVLGDTIDGDKATPDDVLDHVEKLKVETTDTLLFYFSGHGAWDEKKGQYLQLYSGSEKKKGDLFRSTLVEKLKAKKPRLLVCLTDCCNAEMPSRAALTRDLKNPVQWETVQALLLQPSGTVDMTSSAKGELSWTLPPDKQTNPQGSIFTVAVVDFFRHKLQKKPDWDFTQRTVAKWTRDDFLAFRKKVFAYYDGLDEDKKTGNIKNLVARLRKQESQTVYRYDSSK